MVIESKPVTSKQQWEEFLLSHSEANFLQAWQWAEAKQNLGQHVYKSGFYRGEALVGVMIAVVEPAKRGRYLSVAAGPILDWQDAQVVESFVDELRGICKAEKCVFARVRPQIESSKQAKDLFKSLGFRSAQMHLEAELTSQLDITLEDKELLKNMRKNTRREIKRARKRGIKISASRDPKDIKEFYELQLDTAKRHDFIPFHLDRLQKQFEAFIADDQVLLYSAHTAKGELIAQAYIMFYGQEASYHYGASSPLGRKEPGAYLIQWEAIKEAKIRGCTRYNFWGVVHPQDTKHRFYGVTVFKRGFRGQDVEYLHAHDLVMNRWRYILNYFIEAFRKKWRKL